MPHKHKRQKLAKEEQFNLPPTTLAESLPAKHHDKGPKDARFGKKQKNARKHEDDTPRAFRQLMQLHKTGKGLKGLDDGSTKSSTGQKRKRNEETHSSTHESQQREDTAKPTLKIQPGERLKDYAARVDQALPVSGLIAKHNKVDGMREQRKTKHEKKLQRLVNNWKAEEAKRIEKAQEEWDEAEEEDEENDAVWQSQVGESVFPQGKRKGKKRGQDDDDPWKELKKKRDEPKGIFDVAQAPPQFGKAPKQFKIKDGARVDAENVPKSQSLRRQEILSETRQDVIARYREMMQQKRGVA